MTSFGTRPLPESNTKDIASPRAKRVTEATRVPMSVPNLRLSVPEIPGYHLHWMLGKNVLRAQRAGYTMVDSGEVDVEQANVANAASESGDSDLGSNISVPAGGTVSDEDHSPERLYLMKLPIEWWEKDQQALEARNDQIAETLRRGMMGAENDPDKAKRYLKQGQDLFFKK